MLSKTFAVITVILYCLALSNIIKKVKSANVVQKEKKDSVSCEDYQKIKTSAEKVVIAGGISSLMSIINAIYWEQVFLPDVGPATMMILATIALFFVFIILWALTPSMASLENLRKRKQEYEALCKEQNELLSSFHIDKKIVCKDNQLNIAVCSVEQQLVLYKDINMYQRDVSYNKIPFNSIIDCEILEDNATIMKGGVGRAVVGSMIAGETGAIVGAVTRKSSNIVNSLSVRIVVNDIQNPCYLIPIIDYSIERGTPAYKERFNLAQEIYSTIIAIIHNNKN